MKQVVGLDASQNEAAIGVVDQNGKVLFADKAALVRRIRKPNAAFGGYSALDRMLQGAPTNLAAVRAYLDAERGGW